MSSRDLVALLTGAHQVAFISAFSRGFAIGEEAFFESAICEVARSAIRKKK